MRIKLELHSELYHAAANPENNMPRYMARKQDRGIRRHKYMQGVLLTLLHAARRYVDLCKKDFMQLLQWWTDM